MTAQQSCKTGALIIPTSQIKKLRLGESRLHIWGHTRGSVDLGLALSTGDLLPFLSASPWLGAGIKVPSNMIWGAFFPILSSSLSDLGTSWSLKA